MKKSGFSDFGGEETGEHGGGYVRTGGGEFGEVFALGLGFQERDVLQVLVPAGGLFADKKVDCIRNPRAIVEGGGSVPDIVEFRNFEFIRIAENVEGTIQP